MSGGDLPEDYIFAQLHFHWGTTDADGSEHTVDGHEYPLEVRIHSNNVYKYVRHAVVIAIIIVVLPVTRHTIDTELL